MHCLGEDGDIWSVVKWAIDLIFVPFHVGARQFFFSDLFNLQDSKNLKHRNTVGMELKIQEFCRIGCLGHKNHPDPLVSQKNELEGMF